MVGLYTCRSAILAVLLVPCDAAAHTDHMTTSLHKDVIVGTDALLHRAGRGHEEGSAGKLDIILTFEAVARTAPGIHLDGGTLHQADVIIGGNGRFVLFVQRIDGEQTAAAENKLRLAEENGLQVFFSHGSIRGRLAVRQCICAADDDERAFFILIIDCCTIRIRDAHAVQYDGLFLGTVDLEEAVGSSTAELINEHFSAGVVDRDLVAIHRHIAVAVAGDGSIAAIGEADADLALETGGRNVIVRRRISSGCK